MIENQHRWFLRKDERKLVNFIKVKNVVKRVFATGYWPPVGVIFKLKVVRETTTYWGWLPPAKSCYFVPLHFSKIPGMIRISKPPIIPGRSLSLSAEYVKRSIASPP
jgi:hypothetical protein